MNKKSILQNIGVIFLLITISAFLLGNASGQQKNHSKTIENQKTVEVFARGTSYSPHGDKDTAAGRTASLIPIQTVKQLGLHCIAVDPEIIPYGSFIVGKDKNGKHIEGVAVDTGGAVKTRKAATQYALQKGFDQKSPEYNALVFDFYSNSGDVTESWDTFTVVLYKGPCFKFEMSLSEKIAHIKKMQEEHGDKKV